jgi:hypothetical protein
MMTRSNFRKVREKNLALTGLKLGVEDQYHRNLIKKLHQLEHTT